MHNDVFMHPAEPQAPKMPQLKANVRKKERDLPLSSSPVSLFLCLFKYHEASQRSAVITTSSSLSTAFWRKHSRLTKHNGPF